MKDKITQIIALLRENWTYIFMGIAIFVLVFAGSKGKDAQNNTSRLDMQKMITENTATADQTFELLATAELADSMSLASSSAIKVNYDTVVMLRQNSQISDDYGRVSKPITVDVSHLSRGVVSYTVSAGESMESIADKFGISTDQIRWSNNLKTTALSEGQNLLIPSVGGIAYTVKEGDTVDSLASKYGSDASQIISYNDLENDSNLSAGMVILLPSGELPETERPEYVAPVVSRRSSTSYSYYFNATYSSNNKYAYGWCTWYAWSRRQDLPSNMGNANRWDSAARAAGFLVDKSPSAGAVFQTAGMSYYGHVGIVESVNGDGTITISDMNGTAGWGRVGTRAVPASEWQRWNFIHGKQ